MFEYRKISAGEVLCAYLYEKVVDTNIWSRLEDRHFHTTARPKEFRRFFQEAIALNLTRRLILAAEFVRLNQCPEPTETHFIGLLDKPICKLGLMEKNQRGQISRLLKDALICSRHSISTRLRQGMLNWSRGHHNFCYLCGKELNFNLTQNENDSDITLDHLWPQAYGGDSIEENILPACRDCNSRKKRDYASWAGCNVHTLMVGVDPSEGAIMSIGLQFQYALYNRAATAYANRKKISLKESYITLGPWKSEICVLDADDVGDFFNLSNYNTEENEYGTELLQMS